jgi:alcohol dehydrogenase (cytochrome c)
MKYKLLIIAAVLGVTGAVVAGGLYFAYPVQVTTLAGMTRNYLISWSAHPGTITTELNSASKTEAAAARPAVETSSPDATAGDWPSYNRTLTSERYSQLGQINTKNVGRLKVLCTYDIDQFAAFESGLIMVENALIGTTQQLSTLLQGPFADIDRLVLVRSAPRFTLLQPKMHSWTSPNPVS